MDDDQPLKTCGIYSVLQHWDALGELWKHSFSTLLSGHSFSMYVKAFANLGVNMFPK